MVFVFGLRMVGMTTPGFIFAIPYSVLQNPSESELLCRIRDRKSDPGSADWFVLKIVVKKFTIIIKH